jgi:hypothetical protein
MGSRVYSDWNQYLEGSWINDFLRTNNSSRLLIAINLGSAVAAIAVK